MSPTPFPVLNALLIDDETSARADLREKLSLHRNVRIVGEAATISAARALLTSTDYDLVFFDVQLIGGKCFELVPLVRPGTSIVFATAHGHYAVRAFESHALDYLLKPVDPGRLAEAVRRAEEAHLAGPAPRFAPATPPAPSVKADTGGTFSPATVPIFEQDASEVSLTREESSYLRQMLETWEGSLQPTHRLRTARTGTRTVYYDSSNGSARLLLSNHPFGSLASRWWQAMRLRLTS